MRALLGMAAIPGRYYFWGALAAVLFCLFVISAQMTDRQGFANSTLRDDVINRWGAPISQSAPTVRYVESGAVFNTLERLPMAAQTVTVNAQMNYRKRGLVYFSGFDFSFEGLYEVANPEPHDIDIVFVFPVELARRSMLKDLRFSVNGEAESLPLAEDAGRLSWTGRLSSGESASFLIGFRGRGLDAFTYALDPEMPVRNLDLRIDIEGGEGFDYAEGVVPATSTVVNEEGLSLRWSFASLKAGFPFGVILPSERSFDSVLGTMVRRSGTTFALFFGGLIGLGLYHGRTLKRFEAYLVGSAYGFFFVLLPYLAAYMSFYLAHAVTILAVGGLLQLYVSRLMGRASRTHVMLLLLATLVLPTLAIVFERHTGILYSLLILVGLAVLMWLSTLPAARRVLMDLDVEPQAPQGANDDQ